MRYWHTIVATLFLLILGIQEVQAVPFREDALLELRSYVLALINRTRREEGLTPVTTHEGLEKVAQAHAEDTAAHFDESNPESRESSYLAHTSSDGRPLSSRFRDAGVDLGAAYAENAGYWIRGPYGETLEASKEGIRLMHNGMLAEVPPHDSHRQTLLGPFSHVGIGLSLFIAEGSALNAVFLVTDFGQYGEGEGALLRAEPRGIPRRSFPRKMIPAHGGPFFDVAPSDAFAEAIAALKERHITQGYPDGTFQSLRTINRAEFLKILLDSIGFSPIGREFSACFGDVFNQWFAPYVCIAKREGWVTGYDDDTFRPEHPVNRAEAVTLLSRILALSPPLETPSSFGDVPGDSWFSQSLRSAASLGLLPFSGKRFQPSLGMTRGETAEMLYRATR